MTSDLGLIWGLTGSLDVPTQLSDVLNTRRYYR